MQYTDFQNKSKYFLQKTAINSYKYKKSPTHLPEKAAFRFKRCILTTSISTSFLLYNNREKLYIILRKYCISELP